MYRCSIYVFKFLFQSLHLIPVRRNYAGLALIRYVFRNDFLPDYINLSLAVTAPGVISLDRSDGCKYVLLPLVLCHDCQFSMVKLLIAEINNFRMASVVFPEKRLLHSFYHVQHRLEKAF